MFRRLGILIALGALIAGQLLAAAGPVSAASPEWFVATLNGASETPPVTTDGIGDASFVIAADGASIFYTVSYSGLSGPATASHIHLGAVGVPGGILLPLKVGPSPMQGILTASDLTPTGSVTTFAQALDAIRAGNTYVNVHTAAHPAGEIRGQLMPAAHAPQFQIIADQPQLVPQGHLWGFNDYFPRSVTIATGSTFSFVNEGFHTATFLPQSVSVSADLKANGIAQADVDDTARNPNGTTKANENVRVLAPQTPTPTCGTISNPCTFDGTATLSTGVLFSPAPFAVTVTAPPGTYQFHCRIHSKMIGTLNVVAAGTAGTTTDADASAAAATQAAAEAAAATAREQALSKATSFKNNVGTRTWVLHAGASTADGKVSLLEFLPSSLTIHRGDRVQWLLTDLNEPHTVTFPTDLHTDAVPLCENADGTDSPAIPTVNPPTGPQDFGCPGGKPADEFEFDGGNGVKILQSTTTVSDSGLLAPKLTALMFGIPPSAVLNHWAVRVARTAAIGKYTYVCQIHDGMKASITVVK